MQSLGKSVNNEGYIFENKIGPIVFGEPGISYQYSFA